MDLSKDFTKYAKSYDLITNELPFYNDLQNKVMDIVVNHSEKGTVLDIGMGTGNLAIKLAERGFNIIGIEKDSTMLAFAKQKIIEKELQNKITIIQADIDKSSCKKLVETLKIKENTISAIVLVNVLYSLEHPFQLLDYCYRLLKQGGILTVTGPKPEEDTQKLLNETLNILQQKKLLNDEEYSNGFNIFSEINKRLSNYKKNYYSTEEISNVLTSYVGFDEIIQTDHNDLYFSSAFLVAAKKVLDYKKIPLDKVTFKIASEDEIYKILQIRYHFIFDRFNIGSVKNSKKTESDRFDEKSIHFAAVFHNKILASMRVIIDSEIGLPVDEHKDLSEYRQKGSVFEPGRLIKMPFAPSSLGLNLYRAVFEFIKKIDGNFITAYYDIKNKEYFEKYGFTFDDTTYQMTGFTQPNFIHIFSINNPPYIFNEKRPESITSFMNELLSDFVK